MNKSPAVHQQNAKALFGVNLSMQSTPETPLQKLYRLLQETMVAADEAYAVETHRHVRARLDSLRDANTSALDAIRETLVDAEERDEEEAYERSEAYRAQIRGDYYTGQCG